MNIPSQIGPFKIKRPIGHGGMGTVYEAEHPDSADPLAIKILLDAMESEKETRSRFEAEIETLRHLHHPNIVQLFGFGQDEGRLYYAMEYVDGPSLQDLLRRRYKFSWEDVVRIGCQVAQALKHAHDRGIIHRDIKPANILLLKNGQIKVSDYGIAHFFGSVRLTNANVVVGTIEYMAPEQAAAGPITPKSDLYSLGALLYVLLTSDHPYDVKKKTLPELLRRYKQGPPESVRFKRPDVPKDLDLLLLEILSIDPDKRPPNATVIYRRLEGILRQYASQDDQTKSISAINIPEPATAPFPVTILDSSVKSRPHATSLPETILQGDPHARRRQPQAQSAEEIARSELDATVCDLTPPSPSSKQNKPSEIKGDSRPHLPSSNDEETLAETVGQINPNPPQTDHYFDSEQAKTIPLPKTPAASSDEETSLSQPSVSFQPAPISPNISVDTHRSQIHSQERQPSTSHSSSSVKSPVSHNEKNSVSPVNLIETDFIIRNPQDSPSSSSRPSDSFQGDLTRHSNAETAVNSHLLTSLEPTLLHQEDSSFSEEETKASSSSTTGFTSQPTKISSFTRVSERDLDPIDEEKKENNPSVSLQVLALSMIILAAGFFFWYAFKKPSANKLYSKIERRLNETSDDDYLATLRILEDNFEKFLSYYPNDKRAEQIQAYAEELELANLERRLQQRANRRSARAPLSAIEEAYIEAISVLRENPERGIQKLEAFIDIFSNGTSSASAEVPSQRGISKDTLPDQTLPGQCVHLARKKLEQAQKDYQQKKQREIDIFTSRLKMIQQLKDTDPQRAAQLKKSLLDFYGDRSWIQEIDQEGE